MVLGLLDAISGGQLPQGNGLFPLEKAVFEPVMKHVLTNAGDATAYTLVNISFRDELGNS